MLAPGVVPLGRGSCAWDDNEEQEEVAMLAYMLALLRAAGVAGAPPAATVSAGMADERCGSAEVLRIQPMGLGHLY